jgi:hypothetical protein
MVGVGWAVLGAVACHFEYPRADCTEYLALKSVSRTVPYLTKLASCP